MRFDTKLFFLIAIFVAFSGMEVFACHGGDLGAYAKGHYKWSKNSGGITRTTEEVTIITSITTSCDFYAQFVSHEYEYIAEEAAQGQGEHLMVLAEWIGCPIESRSGFATAMQVRYMTLFSETLRHQPDIFFEKLKEMVAITPILKQTCQA